jgi:hypothetical protein
MPQQPACVARERMLEVTACRVAGVPCFLTLDTPDSRGFHLIGHGTQSMYCMHLLFDTDRHPPYAGFP